MKEKYILVLVSCPVNTAEKLAREILAKRIAACVSITHNVKSCYWWDDKIETSAESLLLIKTRSSLFRAVESVVKRVHPYKVPEIIAIPINIGHKPYLAWIKKETSVSQARS